MMRQAVAGVFKLQIPKSTEFVSKKERRNSFAYLENV